MKFYFYFLVAILSCCILWSCSEDEDLSLKLSDSTKHMEKTTRAALPEKSKSENNPLLITDWETVYEIALNTGSTVSAPWASVVATGMPADFCKDIKKQDGWTMLFHTFRKKGTNSNFNYMVFYNLFTGFVKVFYYTPKENKTSSIHWTLQCGNASFAPHSLLEFNDVFTPINGEYAENLNSSITSGLRFNNFVTNQYLLNGWNGFQFHVSRYEDYPKNLTLSLGAESQSIKHYDFTGFVESSIEGNIITKSYADSIFYTAAANVGGSLAEKGLGKILDKHGDTGSKTVVGKLFSSALTELKKALTSNKLNLGNAILSGLKLFFGNSIVKETTTTSIVNLTQNGTITVEGKAVEYDSSAILPLRFNLYEVFDAKASISAEVANPEMVNGDFSGLGVWTLEYTPIVYYNPVTRFVPTYVNDNGSLRESDIEGFAAYPEPIDYDLNVKFNPMIKNYIKSYSVDVDFVESDLFTETNEDLSIINLNKDYLMDNHLYYMETHHERLVMKAILKDHKIDNNLRYFYEWDTPGNRRTVAMVTVTMNVNYNGNQFTIHETRAYKTESQLDDSNNFPPSNSDRAVLINNLNPRVISHTYQGSVPEYEP